MTILVYQDIVLHQLKSSDAAEIFHTIDTQRAYLGQWLPFVAFTKELKHTSGFVDSIVNAPEQSFEYVFTIRVQRDFAGLIGFKGTDRQNKKTEIGYWLSEPYQKKGIVTRAVKKLCKFAFNELDINRIQIKCAVGNTPSKNIPKRLGFKYEGIERAGELLSDGHFTDIEVYSLLKSEFDHHSTHP